MVFQLALCSKVRTSVHATYYGTVDTYIRAYIPSSPPLSVCRSRVIAGTDLSVSIIADDVPYRICDGDDRIRGHYWQRQTYLSLGINYTVPLHLERDFYLNTWDNTDPLLALTSSSRHLSISVAVLTSALQDEQGISQQC